MGRRDALASPGARLGRTATDQSPLNSAARADINQTVKLNVILFDPPSQSVLVGVDLVNTYWIGAAYWHWLPMADESLRVTMLLRLGGVHNSGRR